MRYTSVILAALLPLILSACKVEITAPTGGSVTTTSGSISCAAGDVCTLDISNTEFNETFVGQPAEGFIFSGWKSNKEASFCWHLDEACSVDTTWFSGNVGLMSLLQDPDLMFYLEPSFQSTGFNSLFIGHSFFIPIARTMSLHAEAAGIGEHTQTTVFSGGAGGAPEALWYNSEKSEEIRAVLDDGDVNFLAMTYHGDYPTLTGYINWIDYALERNQHTRIAVGVPWSPNPENSDSDSYGAGWHDFHTATFHTLIDELRAIYPDTEIFCLPYGQSAVELRDLYAAGTLDDVEALVGSSNSAVYTDTLGHAGNILYSVVEMVWLNAIYGVDLSTYSYDPGYNTDVKAIAEKVMDDHDPAYDAPYL